MATPRIKQCFSFFIRGVAMPSVGSLGLHNSSIAICGTRLRGSNQRLGFLEKRGTLVRFQWEIQNDQ